MSSSKLNANMKGFAVRRKTPFEIEKEKKEQKKREEEAAAAAVYAEYIQDFSKKASDGGKTFVRGETVVPSVLYNADEGQAAKKGSTGELYTLSANRDNVNPQSLLPTPEEESDSKSKKKDGKKKSNLELFKEQLKLEQEQREMKKAMKKLREIGSDDPKAAAQAALAAAQAIGQNPALASALAAGGSALFDDEPSPYAPPGSYAAANDTQTTNIYVGNLAPDINEEYLCKTFGKYGPLASVKVMWPRTAEEKARGRNCGFVAFMARADGEKALAKLDGTMMGDFEVKLGWGKAIPIPPQPFYVQKEDAPPTKPTGLPFNARPKEKKKEESSSSREYGMVAPPSALGAGDSASEKEKERSKSKDDVIRDAEVIVMIPQDEEIRRRIHKMIEYVVREGPGFESAIIAREFHNPLFRFLLDYTSPEHVYYRWKLYSILQGDKPDSWSTDPMRIYQGGPWWVPPKMKQREEKKEEEEIKKGQLRNTDRDEFEEMLRSAAMDRESVKSAMGFCLDHCDAAEEIVEVLSESLSILETPIPTKIARLFIVSDVLHNTAVPGASYYRRGFEQQLPTIFKHLNEAYRAISGRIRAEYFKKHVMNVLNAWDSWCLYPQAYLTTLKMTFLAVPQTLMPAAAAVTTPARVSDDIDGEDIDGEELPADEEEASAPAPEPAESSSSNKFKSSFSNASDEGDSDRKASSFSASKWAPVGDTEAESVKRPRIQSKWESDDEGDADTKDDESASSKKQKIDSKWDTDEEEEKPKEKKSKWKTVAASDSSLEEETTRKMREIEAKVIEFREKLERSDLDRRKIEAKVDEYRKELVDRLI